MKAKLEALLGQAQADILSADGLKELEAIRVQYLGKKGAVTTVLKNMKDLSAEERPVIGKVANEVREAIEALLESHRAEKQALELERQMAAEIIDVTMPAKQSARGHRHPITVITEEIVDIFRGMGFSVMEGPQVETVENNFDALNAPLDHPSRSLTDTFYITEQLILRTQTSPVQVRTMRTQKPPIRIVAPGRCFRNDAPDATHSPMFHQIEGLVIDKGITMADLKGTLALMSKRIFGDATRIKFRPHDFPFTEPSGEVDVSCFKCGGTGCRFCKNSGWIEILGCGMVHPNVIRACGLDPEIYNGFAFGMGLDRVTMLKYEIDDMRVLFDNDVRLMKQF